MADVVASEGGRNAFRVSRKSFPPPGDRPRADMALGVDGFRYADLHSPERLKDLYDVFCRTLAKFSAITMAFAPESLSWCSSSRGV